MGKWGRRGVGPRKEKRRERKGHTDRQTEPGSGRAPQRDQRWGQGAAAGRLVSDGKFCLRAAIQMDTDSPPCLSLSCYNMIPQTRWLIKNRHLSVS